MKSLCIKTNNSNLLKYLLNEFNNLDIPDVCFSSKKFKHYKNVIIHYTGNSKDLFLDKISYILSLLVIDELEESFLKQSISHDYFYFNIHEQEKILNICFDIMSCDFSNIFDKKFKVLYKIFYNFISNNNVLYLTGFIKFRGKKYFEILDNIIAEAVNSYIIEKEYFEFISLLQLYINSQPPQTELIHVIYSNSNTILLDSNKEIINVSHENLKSKYLSDISFSNNDYTLNALLTLLPKDIYIHLLVPYIDDFINTLQNIFKNRIHICTNCNICNIYKKNTNPKSL